MKIYTLVLAVLFVTGCSAVASAEFKNLDTDKDNYISLEEAKSNELLGSKFTALDVDKDNVLSATEFEIYENNIDKT